jgi:hypothetical protein
MYPPVSAPPGPPWPAPPMSGIPMSVAPVTAWPAMPPPPQKGSPGKIVAIVLAITIPVLFVCAVLGIVVAPKVLTVPPRATAKVTGAPAASPTRDIRAVPEVGTCTFGPDSSDNFQDNAETIAVVPCTEEHPFETIASGTVEGDTRPTRTSASAQQLFGVCQTAATDFLGAPFSATLTTLVLAVPSADAWANGAHWYRCDLASIPTMSSRHALRTTGSLKGNATPITCLFWDVINNGAGINNVDAADCGQVHNGELAAVAAMPNVDRSNQTGVVHALSQLCMPPVVAFLGRSTLPAGLSVWFTYPRDANELDQNVLCMIAARDLNQQFTASLKGIGSGPIPFA